MKPRWPLSTGPFVSAAGIRAANPGRGQSVKEGQTQLDEEPVLLHQGHHVRHGAEGHQIQELRGSASGGRPARIQVARANL